MSTTSSDLTNSLPANAPTFDVLGVQLQFLVSPEETQETISLYRGTLPPSAIIPLHSHADPEAFYVLEGSLEVYKDDGQQDGWTTVSKGQAIAVAPHVKHALRNTGSSPAVTVAVTQSQLYAFFRELAKPIGVGVGGPPSPEDMRQLFAVAAKYSYWLGSPEENAAIGISLL